MHLGRNLKPGLLSEFTWCFRELSFLTNCSLNGQCRVLFLLTVGLWLRKTCSSIRDFSAPVFQRTSKIVFWFELHPGHVSSPGILTHFWALSLLLAQQGTMYCWLSSTLFGQNRGQACFCCPGSTVQRMSWSYMKLLKLCIECWKFMKTLWVFDFATTSPSSAHVSSILKLIHS